MLEESCVPQAGNSRNEESLHLAMRVSICEMEEFSHSRSANKRRVIGN